MKREKRSRRDLAGQLITSERENPLPKIMLPSISLRSDRSEHAVSAKELLHASEDSVTLSPGIQRPRGKSQCSREKRFMLRWKTDNAADGVGDSQRGCVSDLATVRDFALYFNKALLRFHVNRA